MNDTHPDDTSQCDHEFDGWIAVGLNADGSKRLHSRRCIDCDYSENEWRRVTTETDD